MTPSLYRKINIWLMVTLGLIFLYAWFYPTLDAQDLSIKSACEGKPEVFCRSRGLSRAFAQIIRGNFDAALGFNAYSIGIFSFFGFQFILRGVLILVKPQQKLITLGRIDIIQGVALFLSAFIPMILGL